jgi:hypothetical protein
MSSPPPDPPSNTDPVIVTLTCGHQVSVEPDLFGSSVKCPTCGQVQPLPQSAESAVAAGAASELAIPEDTGQPSPLKLEQKPADVPPSSWPWLVVLPFVAVIALVLTIVARYIGEPWHPPVIMAVTFLVLFISQLGLMVVPVRLLCNVPVGRGSAVPVAIAGGFVGAVIVVAGVGLLIQWFLGSKGVGAEGSAPDAYALTTYTVTVISGLVAIPWFFFSLGMLQMTASGPAVTFCNRVYWLLLAGAVVGFVVVIVRVSMEEMGFWADVSLRTLIAATIMTITPLIMMRAAQQ